MANINVRVDDEIKAQADALYAELGLNMSVVVNALLRKSLRVQGIPFDFMLDAPNAETEQAIQNVAEGKNLSRVFTNTKALMEDLHA